MSIIFLLNINVTVEFDVDSLWLSSPRYFTSNVFPSTLSTGVDKSSTNTQPVGNWSFISFIVVVVNSGASAFATITVTSIFEVDGSWLSSPAYCTSNVFPVSVAFPTDVVPPLTKVQPDVSCPFMSSNVCQYVAFNVVVVNSGAFALFIVNTFSSLSITNGVDSTV